MCFNAPDEIKLTFALLGTFVRKISTQAPIFKTLPAAVVRPGTHGQLARNWPGI